MGDLHNYYVLQASDGPSPSQVHRNEEKDRCYHHLDHKKGGKGAGNKDKLSSTLGGSRGEYSALGNSKVRKTPTNDNAVVRYHPCRRVVGNQQNLHLPNYIKRMVSTTTHWTMGRETEVDVKTVLRREVKENTVSLTKIRYRIS